VAWAALFHAPEAPAGTPAPSSAHAPAAAHEEIDKTGGVLGQELGLLEVDGAAEPARVEEAIRAALSV
jgi:urea transport system substrate-binding protein